MKKMNNEQLTSIAKEFGCTVESFKIDFEKYATKISTKCSDGKDRDSWFYRGKYVTNKWKKSMLGWLNFWTITANNPHVKVSRLSSCIGCEHCKTDKNGKPFPMRDCEWNKLNNLEKALEMRDWRAEDNQDRPDYREELFISTRCELLASLDAREHKKPEDRILDDKKDDLDKQLDFLDYEEKKASIKTNIMALNKRNSFKMLALVEALDSIKISHFNRFMMEENLLILSDWNGKINIVKGKRPVTSRDNYNSMLHLRDVVRLSERTLRDSRYGTMTGYMKYLEHIDDPTFDPANRFDYQYEKEWDYGNDNDDDVSEEQMNELITHFGGEVTTTRSAKKAAE